MHTDRNLRRSLLETIEGYGQHLTTGVVEDMIYPHLQVRGGGARSTHTSPAGRGRRGVGGGWGSYSHMATRDRGLNNACRSYFGD